MKEQFLNDMYLIAIKNKIQRNSISTEDKLKVILEELDFASERDLVNNNGDKSLLSDNEQPDDCISETKPNLTPKEDNVQKEEVPVLEITETKYAQCPEEEGFLNRDLETSDDGQYYVIEMTSDPLLAYYSLMMGCRTSREIMQTPQFAPDFAVVFENSPSKEQEKLSMVNKGTLQKDGRYWKIIKRCKAKWV